MSTYTLETPPISHDWYSPALSFPALTVTNVTVRRLSDLTMVDIDKVEDLTWANNFLELSLDGDFCGMLDFMRGDQEFIRIVADPETVVPPLLITVEYQLETV